MTTLPRNLALAALLALVGCISPTVPVPPPDPENMVFEVDELPSGGDFGVARFSYDGDASLGGAVVYVFNQTLGEGVITTAEADGSVPLTAPFPVSAVGEPGDVGAAIGDEITISFELEEQVSSTCVRIAAGRSSFAARCD